MQKVYVCVDYASACSIHMATGAQVVVVFYHNNIDPVITLHKSRAYNPNQIYIALESLADTDMTTRESTDLFGKYGCHLRTPNIPNASWNDLHQRCGLESVSTQLNWE